MTMIGRLWAVEWSPNLSDAHVDTLDEIFLANRAIIDGKEESSDYLLLEVAANPRGGRSRGRTPQKN